MFRNCDVFQTKEKSDFQLRKALAKKSMPKLINDKKKVLSRSPR